jgi:amino acid permease
MEGKMHTIWRGARPLIGTVVGVGIFALPYAFSRAGYGIGLLELVIVGALNLVALFLYADLAIARPGHGRFIGIVGHDLGMLGRGLALICYFGSHFGALIVYVLVGGGFAHTLFSPVMGGSVLLYQLIFWVIGSLFLFGGLSFVTRFQAYVLPLFFLLIAALVGFSLPFIHLEHFTSVHPAQAILPLGVMLFAFAGMSAVPEMRDVLGKEKGKLKKSLFLGTCVAATLYILFTFAIVGVTGENTTSQAILGLGAVAGPLFVILGSALGLLTVFSAFTTIGVSLFDTLLFDRKFRYLGAWLAVITVPFVAVLAGARDFVGVMGFTGGVMSSLLGMLLIVAYERARYSHELPKRSLGVPQWLVALSFLMFVAMFCLTVFETFSKI